MTTEQLQQLDRAKTPAERAKLRKSFDPVDRLDKGIPAEAFAWARKREREARKAGQFSITNSQLDELERQIELMKRDRPKRDDQRVIDYDIHCARLKHEAQQKRKLLTANAQPVPVTPSTAPAAPAKDSRVRVYQAAPGVKRCPPPPKR